MRTLCALYCLSAKLGIAYLKTDGLALWEFVEDAKPAASPHFIGDGLKLLAGELLAGFAAFL